jgi:futalosine hydrolase
MTVLIAAATEAEVAPLVATFSGRAAHTWGAHDIELLITGIGMVATAARCSKALASGAYDLALNLGVCGSFDPALPPGCAVHVVTDRVAELGSEDGDGFLTIGELGFGGQHEMVNAAPPVNGALARLPSVRGITVNTVHGNDASIAAVRRRFNPQIESMEGAAFMYACLINHVPFAQVRAVSNIVERRNKAAWTMTAAVASLGTAARDILDGLATA